eukprot:375916-Pelagomonas_calceolata.AAC.1
MCHAKQNHRSHPADLEALATGPSVLTPRKKGRVLGMTRRMLTACCRLRKKGVGSDSQNADRVLPPEKKGRVLGMTRRMLTEYCRLRENERASRKACTMPTKTRMRCRALTGAWNC